MGLLPAELVEQAVYLVRSEKVMQDRDLASTYGIITGAQVQAVKRNAERVRAARMLGRAGSVACLHGPCRNVSSDIS
jgi:hypothetical protein